MNRAPTADDAVARGIEKRLVAALIALTLLAASLPYLLGYYLLTIKPAGTQFIGTVYNIDDYCNYLSWLRQTADGHFFLRNLFTTDPQKGLEFNLFFWLLGLVMRLFSLSAQTVLQIARVGSGLGLLLLLARFYRYCLPGNPWAWLTGFALTCLSSGLGWLHLLPGKPVDEWQPEAYTFLSLYASALFTVSTLLILAAFYALLRGEETGRWRYPIIAGVCGGLLGNIHSYDVLHLSAAWGLFLLAWTAVQRGRGVAGSWMRGLLALGLTLPTTLYQYYVFHAEAVFQKRAEVPTLSPPIWYYIEGYGLVFVLALAAAIWFALRARHGAAQGESDEDNGSRRTWLFLICWAVAGLLVIYLPVAFQRKMLMGEHLPLCLLAGWGAAWLTRPLAPRWRICALTALVLATIPSNLWFLGRDIKHLTGNRSETGAIPYLDPAQVSAFQWMRQKTPADAAFTGFPWLCLYIPGETGRAVWAGHWGETPDYRHKVPEFVRAFDVTTPEDVRHAFLLQNGAQYLFYPNDVSPLTFQQHGIVHQFVELAASPPPYLTRVYHNEAYDVYRIR